MWGSPHKASLSGHGDSWETVGRASCPNQSGGGENGLRDGLVGVDGGSGKAHAAKRVNSAPLKTEVP